MEQEKHSQIKEVRIDGFMQRTFTSYFYTEINHRKLVGTVVINSSKVDQLNKVNQPQKGEQSYQNVPNFIVFESIPGLLSLSALNGKYFLLTSGSQFP